MTEFEVTVVAQLPSPPKHHQLDVLADHFGATEHLPGSKQVSLTEHITMPEEADAIAFVRSLAEEALPEGSKIVQVTAVLTT